jgi:ubiquitin-conjugating enzyme E2 J2
MASPTAHCLKRLQIELRQLAKEKDAAYQVAADPHNMLRCYFVMSGPEGTPYAGGRYIGLLEIPPDYPFKPPGVQMCTPSGRFKTGTPICLSNSSYHPEEWSPLWGLRTILIAFTSFFVSNEPTTGSMTSSEEQRRTHAAQSRQYNVERLKMIYRRVLPDAYAKDVSFLEKQKQLQEGTAVPSTKDSNTATESDSDDGHGGGGDAGGDRLGEEPPTKLIQEERSSASGSAAGASGAAHNVSQRKSDGAAEKAAADAGEVGGVESTNKGSSEPAETHKLPHRHQHKHKTGRVEAQAVANMRAAPWRRWISLAVLVAVGLALMGQLR